MKRTLLFALVGVMALSVVTSGGWKFGADQEVDVANVSYVLSTYVGWDFDAPFINMGPISVAGDFVVLREYNWGDSVLSGLLGFDGELVFSYVDDADVVFWTSTDINYAPLPDAVDLIALLFGLDVIGYVNDVLTLNAGIVFEYADIWAGDIFGTSFHVGFDAEW